MLKKSIYVLPLLAALAFGFALGHIHTEATAKTGRHILYYVDPMHPSYKSDKPGIAPDCGMQLVPVYADEAGRAVVESSAALPDGIKIDATAQQLYGIHTVAVEKSSGVHHIRVLGRVAPDDTRIYRVNIGTDGFVKETHDDAVGNHVTKDQKLATIYSPDFLTVTGGYLSANERTQQGGISQNTAAGNQGSAGVQAWADRLRNLGMSDIQLKEVSTTRKIPEDIYVVSPTDGFIIARDITPSQKFERHTEFYKIADLSKVWILADVFGREAEYFHPGSMARVTLPDTGQSFQARVSDALPEVDPSTRTLKLRLEVDNPKFALRPEMFVDVEMPVSLPPGLTVPADSLLDSGVTKRAFVETGNGLFASRDVVTGWRIGDRVQILKGLREGEKVVASGTFLVDSESRLQAASSQAVPITGSTRGSK